MEEFLQQYWLLITLACFVLVLFVFILVKRPQRVKQWLIYACNYAEEFYKNEEKSGFLKLRKVYAMFLREFPVFSNFISFDLFKKWVSGALEELKTYWERDLF